MKQLTILKCDRCTRHVLWESGEPYPAKWHPYLRDGEVKRVDICPDCWNADNLGQKLKK